MRLLDWRIILVCCVGSCLLGVAALLAPAQSGVAAQPDIVILLTDQQRADAMSVAGTPGLRTPAMDGLARGGARFTNAFCATPQCSPSRAALLTGRYPHRTGVMGNVEGRSVSAGTSPPLDAQIPSLGKVFADAGYETAYFGKWHLGPDPGRHGFATHAPGEGRPLTERVLKFLQGRREAGGKRRPLLLFVSWLSPHEIYSVQNRARELDPAAASNVALPGNLKDDLSQKPFPQRHYLEEDQGRPFRQYGAQDWQRYLAFYNRLVEEVDAEIGEVVREVHRDSPNGLIVFSTDHGDLGGAHGLPFKGPAMYEELVRVPLLISWPGEIKPGLVLDHLVSNIDLLPTLCDLAGIKPPAEMDGVSLRPLLTGRSQGVRWRDAVIAEYYGKQDWRVPVRMIRTAEWKYVRYLGYGEEFYHLATDPHELSNLAGEAKHEARRSELAARLDRWMAETHDPFPQLTVTDRAGRILPVRAAKTP